MRKGDIVFIKGSSVITRIITKIDKMSNGDNGEYSHVAIAISDKHMIEANYNQKVSIVNLDKQMPSISKLKVIDLKLTQQERESVYQNSIKYLDKRYDYLQIVTLLFNRLFGFRLINNKKRFICSELVVSAMNDSGLLEGYDCEKLSDMTPNQLYEFILRYSK